LDEELLVLDEELLVLKEELLMLKLLGGFPAINSVSTQYQPHSIFVVNSSLPFVRVRVVRGKTLFQKQALDYIAERTDNTLRGNMEVNYGRG
jgi:hypothetical protein